MKSKLKAKVIRKFALQVIMVALAGVVAGITFKTFFESNGIIPTGISGLALIIHNLFANASINIPTSIVYTVINVIIFSVALKLFGWKFLVLSIIGTVTYTLSMQFGDFAYVLQGGNDDKLLYAIVGAMIYGLSIGVAFRFGGSTGGSEVGGTIINKFFPRLKTGYCLMAFNICVIILTAIFGGISTCLYALVITVISSLTTNLVLDGSKRIVSMYIVTDKDEEISQVILNNFHRGVTKIDAVGEFSKQNKSILITLIPHSKLSQFKKTIVEIDKNAFMFSSIAMETIGEGNIVDKKSPFKTKVKNSKISLKSENSYKRTRFKNKKRLAKSLKLRKYQKSQLDKIQKSQKKIYKNSKQGQENSCAVKKKYILKNKKINKK